LKWLDRTIAAILFGPLTLFVGLAPAPQALELSPIVRIVRVPVDGPGEVIVTVRANGGYSADFEPSSGQGPNPVPEPTPNPNPVPVPAPDPPAPRPEPTDPVTKTARAYFDAVPEALYAVALDVEAGRITNHNEAIGRVESSRAVAKQNFGTTLQSSIEPYIDADGTIKNRDAYGAVLRRAVGGR
jgi:hypothetical protein